MKQAASASPLLGRMEHGRRVQIKDESAGSGRLAKGRVGV